jgi:chromate transporter
MVAVSALYQAGRDIKPVLSAFHGLNVIVIALIANAAITFGRASLKNWRDVLLAAAAAVFLALHGNPVWAIGAAAALGLLIFRGADLPAADRRPPAGGGIRRSMLLPLLGLLPMAGGLVALFLLDRKLLDLALVMLKVDLLAFGGGFASVPLMLHEVVDVRHWLDSRTFMDGIALGQVTPGPIVITATFVGYRVAGLPGALVATVAVFSPSFLMVLVTVPHFDRLQKSTLFRRGLRGVLASFVGLLLAVAIGFGVAVPWGVPAVILAVLALAALLFKVDILWVVLVGAGVSVFLL